VNLGWLMAGVTALDLVWPIFVIAGVEQVRIVPGATAFTPLIFDYYPWSHSLAMAIVWGLVLVGLARRFGVPSSASLLLAGLVVSHWVLDVASHAPDMPLWPGPSPRFGLGLWNSIPATLLVEGTLWAAGIAVYVRGRRFRGLGPQLAFWSLVIVSTALWASGPWSPAPSSPKELGWFALIGWIIIPWAAVADRIKPAGAATAP
jgi:hypothetical protein